VYNFTAEVPSDWNEEDYMPSYATGGTLIAFSPDPLPCNTCSYYYSGYFSIRIFSQTSDPESYALFTQKVQQLGKNPEYKEANLGNKKAVAFANTIATENQGWVYELSLDRDQGNTNIEESEIFQKVASSFTFINLFQ
jgi:hypothetical protein